MKKNILVVAAHPDDEALGCGASISKWSKNGHKVNILFMSEGITARDSKRNFSGKLDIKVSRDFIIIP